MVCDASGCIKIAGKCPISLHRVAGSIFSNRGGFMMGAAASECERLP